MKKKPKYYLGIIISITIITIVLIHQSFSNKTNYLNEPEKIIFHQYGKGTLELSKEDNLFNELLDITNKRIEGRKLMRTDISLDEIYSDNYPEELKDQCSYVEFIYDKEQTLHVPILETDYSTKKEPIDIKYYRLCFTLGDYIIPMESAFRFGDKKVYYACFIYGIRDLKETTNYLKKNNIHYDFIK